MAMLPFFSNQENKYEQAVSIEYKQSRDVDNDVYNIAFYCAEERRLGSCNRDCEQCPFDVRKHTDHKKAMLLRTRAEVDRNNYLSKLEQIEDHERNVAIGNLIVGGIKFIGIAAICLVIFFQCRAHKQSAAVVPVVTSTVKEQPRGTPPPPMPSDIVYMEDLRDWLHTPKMKRLIQNTPGVKAKDPDKQCLAWAVWFKYYLIKYKDTPAELWSVRLPTYHGVIRMMYDDGDWWFIDPNFAMDDMDATDGFNRQTDYINGLTFTNEDRRWWLNDDGTLGEAW